MSKLMLLYVPVLFLSTFMVSQAQWSSDPAVNNAIVRAGNTQNAQRLVSDGQGGAIICWTDERVQQTTFDVYAQRIDKDGFVRWTVNGIAISAAPNSQENPDIVSDDAGGAIIAWTDTRNGDNDIYAQRIDSSGNVLWAKDGVPVAVGTANQADPKITSDGKHGAIMTYNGGSTKSHIYAQRLDGTGKLLWSPEVPVCTLSRLQNSPCIASDGSGGAYIAWAHFRSSQYDVYAQRVDSSGAAYWEDNGIGIATGSSIQDSPALVADGAGNAFLAYSDWGGGSIALLHVVVLKKDGSTAAALRATSTSGGQNNHQLAKVGTGMLGIAWDDGRVAGKKRAYAQIIDSTGAKLWAADGVGVSNRSGDQVTPYIVSDGNDGVIVAWEDKTKGVLETDIYAQRISVAGSLLWSNAGVPVCTAAQIQQFPWMISDDQNGAIVTWEDMRASLSNVEIYASRVLPDGTFPLEPPLLTFSSKTVTFGAVALGNSSTKNITLTNTGSVPVTIASVTSSDPHFSLTPGSNTVAPGGDVSAAVKFEPTSKDTLNAYIVVQSNSIFGPDTVSVTGLGTASAVLQTDKSSLDFGNVEVGSTKSLAINISNAGNEALTISSIATSDPRFMVTITSRVLEPGASFDDTVRFSPTSGGPVSADLTLTSNAANSPTIVPMTGTGVGVVTMTIDPEIISFGNVTVGSSKDTTVTITNTGNDTLWISAFTSGDPRFTLETPVTRIIPARDKTFTLRFTPDAAGPFNTSFTVTSNALSSPDTITVNGIGMNDPAISFAPPQLSFGDVAVDDQKDLVLSINNTGSLNLTVTAITSTSPDFSALVRQFDVPGSSSYNDTIRFMPSIAGSRSGMLIIESNAATSPDTVLVQGTGTGVSPVHETQASPGSFSLFQNYPNPFNPSTSIEFSIPNQGDVRLSVFDHLGQEIAVLANGEYKAGEYTCRFNAADHASGIYLYRLSWNGTTVVRKMILLR